MITIKHIKIFVFILLMSSVTYGSTKNTGSLSPYEKVLAQFEAGYDLTFDEITNKLYFGYCFDNDMDRPQTALLYAFKISYGPIHTDKYLAITSTSLSTEQQFKNMSEEALVDSINDFRQRMPEIYLPQESDIMEFKKRKRLDVTKVRKDEQGNLISLIQEIDNSGRVLVDGEGYGCYFHLSRNTQK